MSNKTLIWLFIFAMLIGGTAAGIYINASPDTSSGKMDMHMNHSSSGM